MTISTIGLTRKQIAWLLDMSDGWVAQRMRAGDLHRPGLPAPIYVRDMLAIQAGRLTSRTASRG